MARILTLIAGVLSIVLSNINSFGLPDNLRVTFTAVGGVILAILAYLEHPTTQTAASTPTTTVVTTVAKTPTTTTTGA